ncbi:transmembrane protein, putative (macronuclear) [Tetrahymena thermophila SB210]|uniref:Transmembrane protein, putative n=1 Tax=Tetrahymena thermophila (strain SB210) TaxID=312017 RepID=I7MI19_TETTS|nr:transmembrane protein, putative [Tetrahymena thermophila SB210]EAS03825.2 transmembrane protein, putative [Tetrahymena thermophila SB210]|eukprot:XP_001024070.2 transmembrane protein, putative [Tetrahymena thermophila SB210]
MKKSEQGQTEGMADKISKLIVFLYQVDISKIKSNYYFAVLMLIFYAQLYSIQIVSQQQDPHDSLLEIFWIITSYTNTNVVLSNFKQQYIGIVVLVFIILVDLMYLYQIYKLMNSSTSMNQNILEKKKITIQLVSLYTELSIWIFFVIKIDLAFGSIFCNSGTYTNQLERRCSYNLSFSGMPSIIMLICGVISLLLSTLQLITSKILYINIDFIKKNPLKPQVSLSSLVSYAIIVFYVFFSYIHIGESFIAVYIIAFVYCLTQLKEYFLNFPVLGKQILWMYGDLNILFVIGTILCLIRDQDSKQFIDSYHMIYLLIFGSVLCCCNIIFIQIQYYKLYRINLKLNYCKPLLACQYLSEICELLNNSAKDNQQWLQLMGILELHQGECEDQYCPCQEGSIYQGLTEAEMREKRKEIQQMSLDQGLAIIPQGIWLSELRKDFSEFKFWLEDFVEYHFYQIVEYQTKNNRIKKEIYVYFYFWSFEIYNLKNYIKALYLMKQHFALVKNKSIIFLSIEYCVSIIIESLIKERDKSMIYSNKQSDIQDAMLVRKFSHLFNSEFQVIKYKEYISNLINKKIEICDKLINNYSSLQNFNKDIKQLVKSVDQIEKKMKTALSGDQENVHYLKLLSLINQVLYCHPQQSYDYEAQIVDITNRDRSLEKDVIHSISILNGDVASIVMSYKDQKCQLEKYSNRTPNFFGYNNEEFKIIKIPEPLLPDIIAVYHNYYVGRIVREGTPKILRRYRQLVAKSKSGFLFPVKLFADYFFNIHDSLCFSALLLKLQTNCEYILVEHDGYIQGFSEGFYQFLRETSKCYNLDPNLLMQANIKIVFPSLLEFLNKYDENGITPNMTNHFTMEVPKRLNEYIREFINRKKQLQENVAGEAVLVSTKKLAFVKKLIFFFLKLSTKFFKEQTTVYDVKMRITKDFLQFTKDNQVINQNLFVLEITNMTISKTFENIDEDVNLFQHKQGNAKTQKNQKVQQNQEQHQEQQVQQKFEVVKSNQLESGFLESNLDGLKIESNLEEVKLQNNQENAKTGIEYKQSKFVSQESLQVKQQASTQNNLKLNLKDIHVDLSNQKLDVEKKSSEVIYDQGQSINLLESQESQQRKQVIQQVQNKLPLNELNVKQITPKNQTPKQIAEQKKKTYITQITLNKYQEVASQNESKQLPPSVNIRRQRSRIDEHDPIQINPNDHEKNDIEILNKQLQEGFMDIIDQEQIEGILPAQCKEKPQAEEEIEKEFLNFCSLTSYVPSHPTQSPQHKQSKQLSDPKVLDKKISINEQIVKAPIQEENEQHEKDGNAEQDDDQNNGEQGEGEDEDDEEDLEQEYINQKEGLFQSRKKTENSYGNLKSFMETSNKITIADKKSKKQRVDGNSNSYIEQGMQINSNVKEIAKTATDKTTPAFVKNIYFMFTFQWVVFIIIVIVSCLNYYQNFTTFQTSIDVMSFSASIMQGLTQSILSTNFLFLQKENLIDFSSDIWHASLLNHMLPIGYSNYQTYLETSLQWSISNPGMQTFLKSEVDFDFWVTDTLSIQQYKNIPITSGLQMIGMSIFQVVQNQNASYVNFQTYPRQIAVNQRGILQIFNQTNEDILKFISNDKSYFYQINLLVLILGLLSIVCSFGLIFNSLHILQTQEKKILGLISRITEEDALKMISLLEISKDCVDPSNQDYLTVNLKAFEERNIGDKRSLRQSRKTKQKKIKSNYLNDRIVVNRLNTSYSYLIISILLVLACATLLYGFINFQSLINNFNSPLQYNSDFLTSYKQYSSMISNFDTIVASKLAKQKLNYNQGILTPSQESSMISDLQQQLNYWEDYFNQGYNQLSQGVISNQFSNGLRQINEQGSCNLSPQIFDEIQLQKCDSVMSGIMSKGFIPEINTILNQINGAISTAFNDQEQLTYYIQKENYLDQTKVSILLLNIFDQIKNLLHSSITSVLNNYGQITIILFTCGSIGYSIILIAGFSYFYITSFRDFQYLRRGVILMPFSRLALDNHTMNLLNNTLQIKK